MGGEGVKRWIGIFSSVIGRTFSDFATFVQEYLKAIGTITVFFFPLVYTIDLPETPTPIHQSTEWYLACKTKAQLPHDVQRSAEWERRSRAFHPGSCTIVSVSRSKKLVVYHCQRHDNILSTLATIQS